MPAACRLGDTSTGHAGFPPKPSIVASPNVRVNGIPVVRVGDAWAVHCIPVSCHGSVSSGGSDKVRVNGQPVVRVGDPISCGDTVATGSGNVRIG